MSLPTGSDCHWKVCGTAVLVPLLNAEVTRFMGCELKPLLEVAVPVAGRLNRPRIVPPPFTSRVDAGLAVLMPTLAVLPLPSWNSTELPKVVLLSPDGQVVGCAASAEWRILSWSWSWRRMTMWRRNLNWPVGPA